MSRQKKTELVEYPPIFSERDKEADRRWKALHGEEDLPFDTLPLIFRQDLDPDDPPCEHTSLTPTQRGDGYVCNECGAFLNEDFEEDDPCE